MAHETSGARAIVEMAAAKADDKKADQIKILDVEGISMLADYFLVCSGQTSIKVRAIAQFVEEELTNAGHKLYGMEGLADGVWVLLDFGTVIVHVMREKEREFYNLERLWAQGRVENYEPAAANQ
ncbi:MAG TPA: ribosome silencing factor [Oscillatoriaceae cyanobacterium]